MKRPYKNTNYTQVYIPKTQYGFNKEATYLINPPSGYTAVPIIEYVVEVLEEGKWVLRARLTPDRNKYRFLSSKAYRVTTVFDSSMKILRSNSFILDTVSTQSTFDTQTSPEPFNLVSQTTNPILTNYAVEFTANLTYDGDNAEGIFNSGLSFSHQTINPIISSYNVEFVGNLYYGVERVGSSFNDVSTEECTFNNPLSFAHQTTNPTFSTYSPEYGNAGGI